MNTQPIEMEVKELSAEGVFEGVLASYNSIDLGNDLIEPGAFTKTIQEHGAEVPLLWQHDTKMPIGRLTLIDGPDALRVRGRLLMELAEAQKAYVLIRSQTIKGLSIGYDAIKSVMDGAIRRLKEIRLWEGSIVTLPMDENAIVMSVKAYLAPMLEGTKAAEPEPKPPEPPPVPETKEPVPETKEGRVLSASTKSRLQDVHGHAVAITEKLAALIEEAGIQPTPDEPAAATKSEPVPEDHSAADRLIEQIRSLLPAA